MCNQMLLPDGVGMKTINPMFKSTSTGNANAITSFITKTANTAAMSGSNGVDDILNDANSVIDSSDSMMVPSTEADVMPKPAKNKTTNGTKPVVN